MAAPDSVTPEIGLWSVPPDPEIPEEMHRSKVVMVAGVYAGPPDEAGESLDPLRRLGTPLADLSGTMSYLESQSALDDLFPDGGRYYWKSHFMDKLTDEAIATLVERDHDRANAESAIYIRTLGGAIRQIGPDETAFAHRSANFNVSVDAIWFDANLDDAVISWAHSTWDALKPFSSGVYVNFAGLGDDADALRAAVLGKNEKRLEDIRSSYDPDGLFETAAHRP